MLIIEKRIVRQEWYETDYSKSGWDSHGWVFKDDGGVVNAEWNIVEHLHSDKFGNPFMGIVEKETNIG